MNQGHQCTGLRACATLVATGQQADVLREGTPRGIGPGELEATHLYNQHQPLIENRLLLKVTSIAAVQSVAPPAAAGAASGTNRAVDFDLGLTVRDPLAHAGKNPVEPAEQLIHDGVADGRRAPPSQSQGLEPVVTQSAEGPAFSTVGATSMLWQFSSSPLAR